MKILQAHFSPPSSTRYAHFPTMRMFVLFDDGLITTDEYVELYYIFIFSHEIILKYI